MSERPSESEIQAIRDGGPLGTQILRKYALGRNPEKALRKLADDGGAREREEPKGISAAEIIEGAESRNAQDAVCYRGAKNFRGESCPCQRCVEEREHLAPTSPPSEVSGETAVWGLWLCQMAGLYGMSDEHFEKLQQGIAVHLRALAPTDTETAELVGTPQWRLRKGPDGGWTDGMCGLEDDDDVENRIVYLAPSKPERGAATGELPVVTWGVPKGPSEEEKP